VSYLRGLSGDGQVTIVAKAVVLARPPDVELRLTKTVTLELKAAKTLRIYDRPRVAKAARRYLQPTAASSSIMAERQGDETFDRRAIRPR
jgi:hypothetical protein